MIGANHHAGRAGAADQLVGTVLAYIVKHTDFVVPPTDRKQVFAGNFKCRVVANIRDC